MWIILLACALPETAVDPPLRGPTDSLDGTDSSADDSGLGEPRFERVQDEVLADKCTGCHYHPPQSRYGSLVLDGNAYEVLTTSVSTLGEPYVVAGSLDDSLVWRKVTGTQGAAQGGDMPPYDALDPRQLALLEGWILAGALDD